MLEFKKNFSIQPIPISGDEGARPKSIQLHSAEAQRSTLAIGTITIQTENNQNI